MHSSRASVVTETLEGGVGAVALEADTLDATRLQVSRQVAHWTMAASRLKDVEKLASATAWEGLERYLGLVLRRNLDQAVERLRRQADVLQAQLRAAESAAEMERVREHVVRFRRRYLRTEMLLDFYADAVNTRTEPQIAALLRACDALAHRSMSQVLEPLGKTTPVVLTYIDSGLGASILKAGLRLWDGRTESMTAAIKLVRHNLYRPTALIHEAGHQVAHITGWNEELAARLLTGLSDGPVARMWSAWASEIAADAFAFAHTGYAAVAGLHDVLAGEETAVFQFIPGDPHPVGYVRVLLGTEMCRQWFGGGPWDALTTAWTRAHPLRSSAGGIRDLFSRSIPILARVAEIALREPMRAFGGRSLGALVDPARVSPAALQQLEGQAGPALFTSQHWVSVEPLRLLAITGYRAATSPERSEECLKQQEAWMLRLGAFLQAA